MEKYSHFGSLLFVGICGLILTLTGYLDPNIYWGFLVVNFVSYGYVEGKKVKYKPHHETDILEKKKP